ncbi:MAG: mercuric reductase [Gemmatimonadaceae bacterium]|nr:mercuric reductase [Gemmatimonadaceae bacterium]
MPHPTGHVVRHATSELRFPSLVSGNPDDARLLALVHPPGWTNPKARDRYHLVVIGGGTGGLVSAAIAAGLGARVALIERALMGGDCLNVGCVPSKALVHAARDRTARTPAGFAAAMERMRAVRADIAPVDSAQRYRDLGVDVFIGDAAFADAGSVAVGDARLRFRRAIVASGARAALPPVEDLATIEPLTNESVFGLQTLPERLTVIGGGPIGCELAQAFARFGSRVTLVESGERLLASDDADAARVLLDALQRDGVDVRLGATVNRAERRGADRVLHLADGGTIGSDEVLVATGRTPNVEGLGLERAGIGYTKRGVTVDDALQTSNPHVYAVGDVASRHQFTHAADALARLAVPNALFFGIGGGKASSLVMPWCTYTSPEVAHVGLSVSDIARRSDVETITVTLEHNDRARIDDDSAGFMRIHLKRGSDRILGATLVAERAGDMIGEIALAITNRVGLGGIGRTIHPYPTVAAVFARAADARRRERLTPLARRAFHAFFRLFT